MLTSNLRCIQSTSKLRPFAHVPSFPWLREWDVTPTDYYGRMPPSVRVVLLLLGAWSPASTGALPIFGIVHARAFGDSPWSWPQRYSPLPLTSLERVPTFTIEDSSRVI